MSQAIGPDMSTLPNSRATALNRPTIDMLPLSVYLNGVPASTFPMIIFATCLPCCIATGD